jgi:hypothetical protein
MLRPTQLAFCAFVGLAGSRLFAGDPGPSQQTSADGNNYHSPIPINDPFPDANYGADHGGSSLSLVFPYTSRFGYTDHSRGQFVYNVASFTPRNSEGVFGMDVWLEQQDGSGNWSPAAINGGLPDQYAPQYGGSGSPYWPVNTPNPGPSPSNRFTWTFNSTQLPPNTNFRIFVYVYIYNQGGGSQGDFPIYSWTGAVNTGSANDAPRISWTGSFGSTNPSQVQAGQTYTISANGQDDNGNLVAVSINKNGQPYAYAGGGDGYGGNSQNPTSDPVGTVTYTAWAGDSYGAQSPTITWTVNVIGKSNQAPVSSGNASIPFYSQAFTPAYNGGSGSGGWQFCIAGYTNWDAGNSSYTGTNLGPSPGNSPSAVWVPSWTPPAPGSYQFWVARDGDSNFNPSGAAGAYTLTVTPVPPVGSFDGVSPNPVLQGQTISGSGWAADAQMGAPLSTVQILVDGGAHGSFPASLGGSRPDVQSANLSWGHWSPNNITNSGWSFSFNVGGLSQGSHTFTAVASDNSYGVSATIGSQSFTVSAPISQTVTISPTSPTIYAGSAITFTAGGGVNGYIWGGSAGGSGGSQTVTFSSPGSYTVTVYSPAGNGYAQSNTATASVSVLPDNQSVGISPTSQTISAGGSVSFTANGGQNGYAWGGSASGGGSSKTVTFPNVGTYNVTVYSPAGGVYAQSNTASATITVTPNGQSVSISPTGATLYAGGSIGFTASGGVNGYVWGGSAAGSGGSQTVTFPNPGTFSVTVFSPAGGNVTQSNTAAATVTVAARPSATIVATPAAINIGQSSAITATFTADSAHGDPLTNTVINIVNPQGTESNFSGFGANPINATFAPNAQGTYTFKAYATTSLSPSWTVYATTAVSVGDTPPTVSGSVSPNPIYYGQNATVAATGGSAGGNLNQITIQYLAPGSGTWNAWQNWAFGNTSAQNESAVAVGLTPGLWSYRLMATDSVGSTSGWQSLSLNVNKATPSVSNWGNRGFVAGYIVQASDLAATFANPYSGTITPPSAGAVSYTNVSTGSGLSAGTALNPGSYDMRAGFTGDSNYNPASADAFWTVTPATQSVAISPTGGTIYAGQQITFSASGGNNGYLWGGAASGGGSSQTVSFPTVGTFNLTVYSPAGGIFAQSNTATATVTVNPDSQVVSISPINPSIQVGGSIGFTAGGGQNGYIWGGAASGSGGSQLVTFPNVGTYAVNVYSPAGGIYAQSNTAAATITVTPASQTVAISPPAPTVYAGQSVIFNATGGVNGYVWGGAAGGAGPTQTVTFANQGNYLVSVYSPAGGNFAQSNTATATATVNPLPSPASAQVTVTPQGGDVKVENSHNQHNSQILVPGP